MTKTIFILLFHILSTRDIPKWNGFFTNELFPTKKIALPPSHKFPLITSSHPHTPGNTSGFFLLLVCKPARSSAEKEWSLK
jgi:hypothetical protein